MAGTNQAAFRVFARKLAREIDRAIGPASVAFQKKIALETFARLLLRTPVDSGHLRANWRITIGRPATGAVEGTEAPTIGTALAALGALAAFSVVYIVNNASYAQVVDEGLFEPPDPGPSSDPRPGRTGRILVRSGFSTQAPAGMTAGVVREILALFP